MRTKIIKIGNSQGIRIPKLFLEQSRLREEVDMEAQADQIILRSVTYPRQGWDEAFQKMTQQGDDQLLDGDLMGQSQWDQEEWQWS
jgi:antitoxin MazE